MAWVESKPVGFYKIWENYEKSQGWGFFALFSIFLFDVND